MKREGQLHRLLGKHVHHSQGLLAATPRTENTASQWSAQMCLQVSMNEMMETIMTFDDVKKPIKHIPGPEGVRGRNSDNKLILEAIGWEPTVLLKDGLGITYSWIKSQIAAEGGDSSQYASSTICSTMAPQELGALRAADGSEFKK